jgi:hypothetical protein
MVRGNPGTMNGFGIPETIFHNSLEVSDYHKHTQPERRFPGHLGNI